MVRVHEGLTPKPLPMREPAPLVVPQVRQEPAHRPGGGGQGLGSAIDGVLRGIFGN